VKRTLETSKIGWEGWKSTQRPKPVSRIIFVSREETYGKFAIYDQTEAGWVLVKEVESTPDWSLAGVLIEAMKGGLDIGGKKDQRIC
jgi:hypothetical protein